MRRPLPKSNESEQNNRIHGWLGYTIGKTSSPRRIWKISTSSLGSLKSPPQGGCRSIQPFLHGASAWLTDRQTDYIGTLSSSLTLCLTVKWLMLRKVQVCDLKYISNLKPFKWVSRGLTSHSTLYRSFRGRFLHVRRPNQQRQSTEGSQLATEIGFNPTWTTPPCYNMNCRQPSLG